MRGIAVGVDAGGSATTASYSRDGVFRQAITGDGASASALGAEEAARRIVVTIQELLAGDTPAVIFVGAAGAGRRAVAQAMESAILAHFPQTRIRVADDAQIALRASVTSGPGMVLVAGTGSIAYAENAAGQSFRAGGYGYLLGDDGSGFAIGLAAAKFLARVYDGRAIADELSRDVEARLNVEGQSGLFDAVYGVARPVPVIASLARSVLALAGNGVRSAQKIVQGAGLELAELVKVAAKKADLANTACPLILAGGLLNENSMLSFLLETRLQADLPSAQILKRVAEPHRGALSAAEAVLA
ncbi:MAG: hypothetical protein M3126_04770 [Candidatus Eremiobacteraeota bacterium]|nr:hypothetical protein [Candidatus Eremiobacteraeota bacterium]